MWKQMLVLSLAISCSWQMRIKRQENESSCEWWQKDCGAKIEDATPPPSPDAASATTLDIPVPPLEDIVKTDSGNCACVPYYLCKEGEIITDGAGIIDIRKTPKRKPAKKTRRAEPPLVGGHCQKSIYVCCRIPPGEKGPDLVTVTDIQVTPPVPHVSVCGQRNPDGVFVRISNFKDNEAQFGEFPWMAVILKPTPLPSGVVEDRYVCGGSLVHPQVVLTAAHCVAGKDPKSLKVRLGEWDTSKADELAPHQDVPVIDSVIHEGFYAAAVHNDFALLYLAEPANLGGHIDTICLPTPEQLFDPAKCLVSGWGKDEFGKKGRFQQVLKRLQIPVVPREPCQNALRTTRLGPYFNLHESFLCAGGIKGVDTCKGDGGSPLVCPIPGYVDRFVQVGIVAWGIGCGDEIPGVYADVVKSTLWIQEKINQRLNLQADYFLKQLPASS